MNKTMLRVWLGTLLAFACINAMAQKKTLENVLKIQLRNMGAIYNKNQISGYYMFYKVDRINSKTNSYLLRILDQNLNEVSENKIEESKYFSLQEGAYNEDGLMFKFYDAKERKIVFYQYDNKSVLKGRNERKIESKYEMATYTEAEAEENDGTALFSVPGKGFVDYGMKKGDKLGYAISFYTNDGRKGWTYESPDNSKEVESANFFGVSQEVLISAVAKKKNLIAKDYDTYLLALNVSTGQVMFEKKMEDPQFEVSFMNAFVDNTSGNIALLGQYFKKKDNVTKDRSLGLCSYVMTTGGDIITKNYASWATDVRKLLPVNAQGKIEDVGFLYFHKIVKMADGRVVAIGEQYRKSASGLGIAMTVMSGRNQGVTKMVIEDMVLLTFTPQFKLEEVKIFDKSKTTYELGPQFDFMGSQMIALLLKSWGYFDYSFTQLDDANTRFSVGYVDFEKNKGEKNKLVFGAVTYADKQYSTDKISLETEASSLRVMPAKPGYVLISEYYRKAKKLDMRMEKINY